MATEADWSGQTSRTPSGQPNTAEALATVVGTLLLIAGIVLGSIAGPLDTLQLVAIGLVVAGFAVMLRVNRVRALIKASLHPSRDDRPAEQS